MADDPENHTLRLLREIREEQAAFRAEMQVAVAALSAELKIVKSDVSEIAAVQKNQGARLNAIDGRLALIERHTGMVEA